jgi:hypothetical protein
MSDATVRPKPLELIVDGVNSDGDAYRDTLYLLVDNGIDIFDAVRSLCERHDLELTQLAEADTGCWTGSGLTPAHLDRATFLEQVTVLPTISDAFQIPLEFIYLDDPDWQPYGWD